MPLLENLLSQGTIERLGWILVHFLWQAMAVALLLAVLLRLLRRAVASVRYGAACGALALMLILPLVTMQFVEVTGPAAEAGPLPDLLHAEAVEPTPAILHTVRELPPLEMTPPLETASLAVPVPLREKVVTAVEPALPYIAFGWLAGVFGLSAWHLGGWTQLHRLKNRMAREAGAALNTTLCELAAKLRVRRAVTLLESAIVEVPTVLGWLRPVILIPASALTGLTPDQLRAILAHELAHIRRCDYLANILQTAVEILGFYHPAVWWVSSRIRIERENCCDDLAVQVCGNSLQYARALTSLEEIRHSRTDLALAASGGSLMARIARLLGRPVVDDRRFAWLPGLIALLLVVGVVIPAALVLGAPDTPPATPHVDLETTEGQAPNADATTVIERSPQDHAADSNETQVRTDWVIAKVRTETVLDRETLRLIGDILSGERPQISRELAAIGQKTTLGHVLKTYVARQSLSQETGTALIDLLKALDPATIGAKPSLLAVDGRDFELQLISLAQYPVPLAQNAKASEEPGVITVNYGTRIKGTSHIETNGGITLEIGVTQADPGSSPQADALPVVRTMETSTTVTAAADRYFSLLVESPDETPQGEDARSLLVMVKPSIVGPASRADDSSAAPTRQDESRPRQVLLDARVVEIEPARLTESGVEWSFPARQPGTPDDDWTKGIQVGYLPDSAFTNSFLAALNRLDAVNQAKVVSNPQIVAMEGCRARLRSSQEQWLLMDGPSASTLPPKIRNIGSGRILDVTCRISDRNDITLDVAIEVSNSVPGRVGSGSDLPIITRRMARNSVTVMNGGTVALAGLTSKQGSQKTKETAIFITATLVPDVAPPTSSLPSRKETASSAPARRVEPALPPSTSAVSAKPPLGSGESPAYKASEKKFPRQTFLDARIVEMDRSDLTNLIAQWNFPAAQVGQISTGGRRPEETRIAFLSDRAHTNSFWKELRSLVTTHRARIMNSPQLVSTDGHPVELLSFGEVWANYPDRKSAREASRGREECRRILAGTSLLMTPTVGDSNDIMLEIEVRTGDSVLQGRRDDRSTVMRRVARDSVTVVDGGIVAVAGLPAKLARRAGQTTKEIVIFVTATRIPDINEVVPLATRIESSDPVISAMSVEITRSEQDLIVLRRTHAETNPEVVRQKAVLKALKDKRENRRTELNREFENDLQEALSRSRQKTESPSSADVDMRDSLRMANRDSYVNSDPLIREWATSIAAMEKELIVLQKTHLPSHPILQQKQDALNDMYRRLEERRKMLQNGLDARIRPQG